ncbi:MAG: SDR family oxidoreductase [Dokdonella sp.]
MSGKTSAFVKVARKIQHESDAQDARKTKSKNDSKGQPGRSPQTSERKRPGKPTEQHLRKPGREADLVPKPQFEAPNYRGSGKLDRMVALITGGDSGIGRAVAVLYAREGADVAIVHLGAEDGDAKTTAEHIEREGGKCLLIAGDVRDFDFCEKAVDETIKKFGKLDILVNNAAFQEHADSIEELSLEHFDLTVKTNLYGYFHMAKAALPHMKAGASIINTGSETGLFGSKKLLDYSSTKGAIHAFTKALAANVIDRGIRVNAVAPGPVWTPLNPADRAAKEVPDFGTNTDMKRPAQPEELSPAYVFLAAPCCSSYITGIVLPVLGSLPS